MTMQSNGRLAGTAFLLYIAAGVTSMAYAAGPLLDVVLSYIMCFSALTLAVTLHAITRVQDPDIAMLGLTFRAGEGILGAIYLSSQRSLLSLAGTSGADTAAGTAQVLNAFIHGAGRSNALVAGMFFAMGSTCFSWLLLKGRMIPVALACLGVAASLLLVVGLPLLFANVLRGPVNVYIWLPMLAFEVPLALWLLVKGPAVQTQTARLR